MSQQENNRHESRNLVNQKSAMINQMDVSTDTQLTDTYAWMKQIEAVETVQQKKNKGYDKDH